MTNTSAAVGGVDSHKDTIHVAVITGIGEHVADQEFATTTAGYRRRSRLADRARTLGQGRD